MNFLQTFPIKCTIDMPNPAQGNQRTTPLSCSADIAGKKNPTYDFIALNYSNSGEDIKIMVEGESQ